ncbi:phospholipase D family protein [Mycolicibacterium sp. P1-18]|uniref:phospholipase D family protein n=1 Tax=Mycolicibacterium sp. P1-18 TaxID=2024615 RepID=UPI0011F0A92E|nr:phospholipase D family protein [Mycolicibacterium sp. P1-18]
MGRVEETLAAITAAASDAGAYRFVDVAVAYATYAGVALLDKRLGAFPSWPDASKRFLVSMDFGTTEPAALAKLSELSNAEVRIPNGESILASPILRPPSTFHPKSYLFRQAEWRSPSALVVGSANLTVSALATGSEVVVKQAWTGSSLSRSDRRHLKGAGPFLDWFEDAWATAVPLREILNEYRARYESKPGPRTPPEEETPATQNYLVSADEHEVYGALTVQLAAAKTIWFETDKLYHNRGPGKTGNQLDTPRGTRVFFGFSPQKVQRNTIFGDVNIQVPGFPSVPRSVRFGNNEMDKINLPIPGTDGPESYDNAYLLFERSNAPGDDKQFTLTVTDRPGLVARIGQAANSVNLAMGSGREYGLLF